MKVLNGRRLVSRKWNQLLLAVNLHRSWCLSKKCGNIAIGWITLQLAEGKRRAIRVVSYRMDTGPFEAGAERLVHSIQIEQTNRGQFVNFLSPCLSLVLLQRAWHCSGVHLGVHLGSGWQARLDSITMWRLRFSLGIRHLLANPWQVSPHPWTMINMLDFLPIQTTSRFGCATLSCTLIPFV